MSTGTLDIDKYVCTGTKSENPFAIHSTHCCSLQEARLCPSRQFWYVPVKDGYTVLCLSTNIARKNAEVGHQSQRDFFHEQAGPELNAALHQLKDSAFLLPEFALCFTTSDKKSLQTSKIAAITYSCLLVLCAQHSFITLKDWWSKKVEKLHPYIN